jgi:tetratricopeptide (TPR) repeat protein
MPARRAITNNRKLERNRRPRELPRGVHRRSITVGIYLLLTGLSLAVFGQTIRYNFVNFDDDVYVYNSPAIQAGVTVKGIALAFTAPEMRNWHPLTTISHMLDCQLHGLNAGGHHATNVALHTLAVLLLFGVLRQMTGAVWKSAIVAALFAIHPLHVESVAWVSERKDVLSAVFFMLTLCAYVCYVRAPSIGRYLIVAVIFAFGLMSKSMLVSTPIVLVFLDYWPLGRIQKSKARGQESKVSAQWSVVGGLLMEKIPLVVLSAAVCVITFVLQKRTAGSIPPLPLLWRVQNAFASYAIYVWKTLWPTHLAVFYPHPNDTLAIWEVISAIALLLAITASAIVFRKQRPYLFTGWFWYLVMLVPVIGIVQVGEQGHADRYTYLPHIGLFLLAVWFAADVTAVHQSRSRFAVAAAVAIAIIAALAWRAFIQTSYWRNSETLWTHALAVTPDNDVAHNNLGYLCVDRGELDKAISHFESAARIRSGKRDPHYDASSAFIQMNLANALDEKGQVAEALIHYRKLLELQPDNIEVHNIVGTVLIQQGRVVEAVEEWQKVLAIQPDNGNAMSNLAWVFATSPDQSLRDGPKAVELAERALRISGGRIPILFRTLAAAYAESGRFSEAIQTAQQGIELANSQGNSRLATELQGNIALYQEQRPLRDRSLTHGNSPSNSE